MVQQEFIQVQLMEQLIIQLVRVVLTSANITSISNVDGVVSSRIRITTIPNSNDIVPVRNQTLEIDTLNSTVNGAVDTIVSGSSQAGTSFTTTSSY